MQALLVNQSPVSSITYSNKMRVIYDGVEQDAELRKYPSGKIYFRTENAHFVPVNEVGVLIPLTKEKNAIVDLEDYISLLQKKWCFNGLYAVRGSSRMDMALSKRKNIRMHREILNAPDHMEVDHKDGDKLNNRRTNLRLCTKSQNMRNISKMSTNTSGYKGVTWASHTNRWKVQIMIMGKHRGIGYFTCKIEAARAYNEAALKHHGEFARLNIISNG